MAITRRARYSIFLVVFLDLVGFGIIVPILPFYTRSFPGGTELVIGLLAATYSGMQFLGAPVLGSLSDEYGRRPILVLSLAGGVLAWTIFGLANALWMLFLARAVAGLMGGNISTAQAYISDVTTEDERASALGMIGAAFGMGFIFGPGIGAVLSFDATIAAVDAVAPAPIPINRFSLPSFGAAAMSLVAAVVTVAFLPESRHVANGGTATADQPTETRPGEPSQIAQLRAALTSAHLRPLLVSFFTTSLAFSGVTIMFIPFVADVFGYTASQSALLLTYVGGVSVFVQGVLIGPLTDRFHSQQLAVGGASLLVLGLVALPLSPILADVLPSLATLVSAIDATAIALLLVLTILPAGNGILNVSLTTLVSTSASDDRQGSAFGLTQGAGSLARTIGPVVMGGIYTVIGSWAPFVLGGLLLLPVIALLARLREGNVPCDTTVVDSGQAR